jgi:SAM-dependent methyltransferase
MPIKSCLNGHGLPIKTTMKRGGEWWKDPFEKGWYPLGSIARDWKDKTKAEALAIQKILGLRKGARILDVACGVGRHSIALARLGYDVTGLDISKSYLETARRDARKAGAAVRFVRADMREIPFEGEFDAAINLFSSFGYFKNQSDDQRVLRQIRRALAPGGKILIDNANLAFVKKHFSPQSWLELSDGTLVLEKRTPLDRANVFRSDWIFVRPDGKRSTMASSIRGYDGPGFRKLLSKAGFVRVKSHPPLVGKGGGVPFRLVLSAQAHRVALR